MADPTYNDAVIFAKVRLAVAVDTDGDGLTDDSEARYGSDPEVTDTDGDGLTDGEEAVWRNTSPTLADSDGDGFTDGEEVLAGTDPLDPASRPASHDDLDGNGLPDAWEIEHFGARGVDPDADPDNDWLTNAGEYAHGTDPNKTDTDGDGLCDGEEVEYGHDPLKVVASPVVQISFDKETGRAVLSWTTVYGFNYMPQYKDDLRVPVWSNLVRRAVTEWNEFPKGMESIVDRDSESHANRFYRVVIPVTDE